MASLVAILLFASAFRYGYSLDLKWPSSFYVAGDYTDLMLGISKPFELWYTQNLSRTDVYGGTVKRYYWCNGKRGRQASCLFYKIHPEANRKGYSIDICRKRSTTTSVEKWIARYLPSLKNFQRIRKQKHQGTWNVEVWIRSYTHNGLKVNRTMILGQKGKIKNVPIQYTMEAYNVRSGRLTEHVIIIYGTWETKVSPNDLKDISKFTCYDFPKKIKQIHPNENNHDDISYHSLIEENSNKNISYNSSVNQFADSITRELQQSDGARMDDLTVVKTHPFPHSEEEIQEMASKTPENYDMRLYGYVSGVKAQGDYCTSSWAFAAAAAVEGALASKGWPLLELSPQFLVDCAGLTYNIFGCGGIMGSVGSVLKYIYDHGIPTTKDYGLYLADDGGCRINSVRNLLYKIKGYKAIPKTVFVNYHKSALYTYGPLIVRIRDTNRLRQYTSGIYEPDCSITSTSSQIVTVVGYGVQNHTSYWIIKNSWGQKWGEAGYMLMAATNITCNPFLDAYYLVV